VVAARPEAVAAQSADSGLAASVAVPRPPIVALNPPEQDFFAKRLDYDGIAIKAPAVVVDEALDAAYDRLSLMLTNLPAARARLREAGAELHIIGRDQVTTDLPEWRHDKGKPLAEYNGLTRDQRTRGMGGLLTSCGEENLLRLEQDRYRGRDICVHEFAHNLLGQGVPGAVREKVRAQYRRSLEAGRWVGSYAGSNDHEFFAELAMWYFGTHGDLTMQGEKPANGPAGLRAYDPEAFHLLDDLFQGRFEATAPGTASMVVAAKPDRDAAPEADPAVASANLALVAAATTSYVSGHETITALNDGSLPAHSDDKSHGAYGNWPRQGTQWVQYEWSQPIKTARIEVYWFDDQRGVRLPMACRLRYWDGSEFKPVAEARGLGLAANQFNVTTFPEITTARLRLEFDGRDTFSTGLLEWRVLDAGGSPNFPPAVEAGVDRYVVLSGLTHLEGRVRDDGKPSPTPEIEWHKASGPGTVTFGDPRALATSARFSEVGNYVLELTANDGESSATRTVQVTVTPPPPTTPLETIPTTAYTLTSPFWRPRARALIVNWIPHCVRQIEDPKTAEGGIGNFVEAGRKLAGATDARHVGAVFANTWVYNTIESICVALQVDPQGDEEVAAAQAALRRTLEDWIPKILGAQEPDGYLHTMYTIQGQRRWSNKHDHEDYQAGYFLEAAVAHCWLTGGQDRRMYDAARRLADCWVRNIGPAPKRSWYPGHQELEMALARFATLVEHVEGAGKGAEYLVLAKFLLDQRRDGEEYDQSHVPVTRQYEAVGHAVRAAYSYAGMADVALATGDMDYHSAIQSLWNSIVNRKYYVTGGIGSGETSEGFGQDYSLPNRAYCESCAGTGELLFQHKLNRAYQAARYADLYEETLYNAILGGVDLEGRNYTYTNPLDSSERRYPWHVCPCCVGNLPRTLLSLPTWTYAKGADSLYVNLFIGSTVDVGEFAATRLRVTQETDYPWQGKVKLTLHPAEPRRFSIRIRVPDRRTSDLYTPAPVVGGLAALAVDGEATAPLIESGYAVLTREWKPGSQITFELPLQVQRVTATDRIAATRGRVALRYGPLIYNLESTEQDLNGELPADASLAAEWRGDLLGGVMVIIGRFADGKPLLAVPNYARLNRGGRSIVWVKRAAVP